MIASEEKTTQSIKPWTDPENGSISRTIDLGGLFLGVHDRSTTILCLSGRSTPPTPIQVALLANPYPRHTIQLLPRTVLSILTNESEFLLSDFHLMSYIC